MTPFNYIFDRLHQIIFKETDCHKALSDVQHIQSEMTNHYEQGALTYIEYKTLYSLSVLVQEKLRIKCRLE